MSKCTNLASIVNHKDSREVYKEIIHLWEITFSVELATQLTSTLKWTKQLFSGLIPGYRACNTVYHDFQHATDTTLALMRMIHGAVCFGINIPQEAAVTSLAAAMLHDAGFIQREHERTGTGAQYTKVHVQRSISLLDRFEECVSWISVKKDFARKLILCTDLAIEPENMEFTNNSEILLARMLAAADLWAQMADRLYLEKLVFLYREMEESGINIFSDENDLISKTPGFYQLVEKRLRNLAPVIDGFLTIHFRNRWGIDGNLYIQSIERQLNYLADILQEKDDQLVKYFRRDGVISEAYSAVSTQSGTV